MRMPYLFSFENPYGLRNAFYTASVALTLIFTGFTADYLNDYSDMIRKEKALVQLQNLNLRNQDLLQDIKGLEHLVSFENSARTFLSASPLEQGFSQQYSLFNQNGQSPQEVLDSLKETSAFEVYEAKKQELLPFTKLPVPTGASYYAGAALIIGAGLFFAGFCGIAGRAVTPTKEQAAAYYF